MGERDWEETKGESVNGVHSTVVTLRRREYASDFQRVYVSAPDMGLMLIFDWASTHLPSKVTITFFSLA